MLQKFEQELYSKFSSEDLELPELPPRPISKNINS